MMSVSMMILASLPGNMPCLYYALGDLGLEPHSKLGNELIDIAEPVLKIRARGGYVPTFFKFRASDISAAPRMPTVDE